MLAAALGVVHRVRRIDEAGGVQLHLTPSTQSDGQLKNFWPHASPEDSQQPSDVPEGLHAVQLFLRRSSMFALLFSFLRGEDSIQFTD